MRYAHLRFTNTHLICIYGHQVIKAYVIEHGGSSVPKMLLMDRLRAHWVSAVKEKVDELGFQTEKVPAGMTFLCQPIDVGIAKPFKDAMKKRWTNYMLAQHEERIVDPNA